MQATCRAGQHICSKAALHLNMGAAPSHTAQALMPLFQKPFTSPAPWKSSLFATAPVDATYHESIELQTNNWTWHQGLVAALQGLSGPHFARQAPTCGQDDSLCFYSLLVGPDHERPPGQVDLVDSLREDAGPKAFTLCPASTREQASA